MSSECPRCCGETTVTESRTRGLRGIDLRPGESATYRRRRCPDCGHRFTTYELTVDILNRIISARGIGMTKIASPRRTKNHERTE